MSSIRKLLTLLCCYLCGALLLSAQQESGQAAPLGIWEGTLQVSGSELPLRFNIFKDQQERVCCTMDSPSQMATGIKATIELAEGIVITIPNLYIRYEGKLTSSDTIVGTFAQGGMSLPLTLVRASKPAKADRPQTPQPPYPYETEEVTFYNGTAPLHGTLTYPVGHQAGSRVEQVVLFVSGSGIQDRDETLAEHKPFAVLADYLARHGVATLRYDDRGYHDDIDSATVAEATTATLADDAAAAVHYLRGRKAFDKVGVLGHSEGGTIAFMLAARGIPDFIISLAGSTLPGKEVLQDQMDLSLVQAGLSEELRTEYLRATMATFDLAAQSDLRGEALVTKVLSEGHYQLPIGLVLELKKVADGLTPWLIYFTQYDPKGDIAQTHCPVLALNGSLDQQVLADKHLAIIEQSLPMKTPRQVRKLEGLNHLFQHATTGAVSEYYQISETIAPEVLELIAEWISKLTK
ncbi:alpha/beta hydrolase family protein [Porphyromonas sp.]|uniref:alpha/beta hydrolase family protein n=1 Tax=Porphyromonas sp. TaxID=1924944 RepID=UPI003AAD6950